MASLPASNNTADASAPGHTSRQRTGTSGNHLKSMAKRIVSTTSETAKFIDCHSSTCEPALPAHVETAASAALTTSDTISKNPSAITPTKEMR